MFLTSFSVTPQGSPRAPSRRFFSLRLKGTNSALYPQRGQDNALMLQSLTFRSLHYLVNFILLIHLDWLTVTLKAWSWGPHLIWVTFSKFRGVCWTSSLYHYYPNKFQNHQVQQENKREEKANNFLLKLTASKKSIFTSNTKSNEKVLTRFWLNISGENPLEIHLQSVQCQISTVNTAIKKVKLPEVV